MNNRKITGLDEETSDKLKSIDKAQIIIMVELFINIYSNV